MILKETLNNSALIFDGAMGTYYTSLYGQEPEFCEAANLTFPGRIEAIHREYIAAGAMAIKTNTFGANAVSLETGDDEVKAIITAGWNIAVAAAGHSAAVFADIGPVLHAEGFNDAAQYEMIVDHFLSLGAENFLFETFSSAKILSSLARRIKTVNHNSTVICSFAVLPDGFTREGVALQRIASQMENDVNVDAFGLNCACGVTHMAKNIAELIGCTKPVIAMPNAGYPTLVGNRVYFENNSDYYGRELAKFRGAGVSIFGGCCGTTPEHIKSLRSELRSLTAGQNMDISADLPAKKISAENRLWDKLESGKKVFAVELDPPANSDIAKFMSGAKALRDAGADAVTIADCPVSRARADSSLLACKLHRELGIDPIPHMTCRDRNIIATKALLLGLNVENVNNILVVTGDPVPTAERGTIKSVFNFNSMVLASFIRDLGPELENGPFRVFGALNLNALNFDIQLRHAQDKQKSGVSGFLTQPVHSERALENLKLAHRELKGKILGGVMPIVSHKNACFMNSEIAGITVSDDIVRRYEGLDRDASSRLAVELTTEIGKSMADYVDGYYMITPFSRTDLICEIMKNLKR
jgi:homocysteine S-methyltransferase